MLRFKHLRLDQEKIERVRKILKAKTETEALDKALDKVIQVDQERLRRKRLMSRMIDLRNRLGKMKEDSTMWIQEARKERDLSPGKFQENSVDSWGGVMLDWTH